MKQLLIVLLMAVSLACTSQPKEPTPSLRDSVTVLTQQIADYQIAIQVQQQGIDKLNEQITCLSDSLIRLYNKPLMSTQQFIDLYRYNRILKYYKLCERKPTNWKYFKGWVRRAINE